MAVQKLTTKEFDAAVASGAVLIDFFATWCAPCRMLAPSVHALAEETPGLKVYQVDVDDEPALAARFRVMSIPTFMVFRNGAPTKVEVGMRSKDDVIKMFR